MEQEELTNVLEDVDDKERRDQVVDALHVAAGWMADGPDEKDPLKYLQEEQTQGFSLEPDDATFAKQNDVNFKSRAAKVFFSRTNSFFWTSGRLEMQIWNITEEFKRREK